ncbi:porin [Cerasicoccus arenae]|uniref:Porin n=1 Tax=Cerasicoccus arenae TaxID=424488 RepID=A0A8J3GC89_9BACT|nr:porin [Cerasicoccus arenae]MBK1857157.1 hypothetical protein [Cerasicoccus arenae]GHB92683.1 hypothetical protein GCM10007047_04880 [Cerasicoccus arenae]
MKLLPTLFLSSFLIGGVLLAQDAAPTPMPDLSNEFTGVVPLSELVRQGVITQEQANKIKGGAIGIEPQVKSKSFVKSLTISGFSQFSYAYIAPHDEALPNPASTSTFYVPNLAFGVAADLGSGWSTNITANFGSGFSSRNYLDKAFIEKKFDDIGAVSIGYNKAHFGLEQYTSSRYIPATDRSIATSYFTSSYSRIGAGMFPLSTGGLGTTRLGLGARRLGVFWEGEIPGVDGLEYFAEITQGFQNFSAPATTGTQNQLGYSGGVQYSTKWDDGKVTVGVNGTYMPEGNSLAVRNAVTFLNKSNAIAAIDPFVQLKVGDFQAIGEFLGAYVENGRATGTSGPLSVSGYNSGSATPLGANVFLMYLFNDTIEPVFRFSMIDSDQAGVNPSVVSQGPAFGGAVPGVAPGTASPVLSPLGIGFFNAAQSYYFGLNWYILGNNAKISAGYERVQFGGRWDGAGFDGPDASEDVIRIRAQIVF